MSFFIFIGFIFAMIALTTYMGERRSKGCSNHRWKLKYKSKSFDYYECKNWMCNHSKGHHK